MVARPRPRRDHGGERSPLDALDALARAAGAVLRHSGCAQRRPGVHAGRDRRRRRVPGAAGRWMAALTSGGRRTALRGCAQGGLVCAREFAAVRR